MDLNLTLSSGYNLTPSRADAGTQGENLETVLKITMPTESGYRYRIEICTSAGQWDSTDFIEVTDGKLVYGIPSSWTEAGGIAAIRVNAYNPTLQINKYSTDTKLLFKSRELGTNPGEPKIRGLTSVLLDAAQKAANDASDYSNLAHNYANDSHNYANDAYNYAQMASNNGAYYSGEAQNHANNAANSAAAASASENNAASSESSAGAFALSAQGSAGNASNSANSAAADALLVQGEAANAANFANAAANSANSASGSANNAAGSSSSAGAFALSAQGHASNASNSANAASASENNAANSASDALTVLENFDPELVLLDEITTDSSTLTWSKVIGGVTQKYKKLYILFDAGSGNYIVANANYGQALKNGVNQVTFGLFRTQREWVYLYHENGCLIDEECSFTSYISPGDYMKRVPKTGLAENDQYLTSISLNGLNVGVSVKIYGVTWRALNTPISLALNTPV